MAKGPDIVTLGPGIVWVSERALAAELGLCEPEARRFVEALVQQVELECQTKLANPVAVAETRYWDLNALCRVWLKLGNPSANPSELPAIAEFYRTFRRQALRDRLSEVARTMLGRSRKARRKRRQARTTTQTPRPASEAPG